MRTRTAGAALALAMAGYLAGALISGPAQASNIG